MSIDATVEYVRINEDGSGALVLSDRKPDGCAGQSELRFTEAPHEVTALNGFDVWGGSEQLMLGDIEIAQRIGYTSIRFRDAATFVAAVEAYRRRKR